MRKPYNKNVQTALQCNNKTNKIHLLEEIVPAIEFAFPREAFFCKVAFAFATLDAFSVPGSVQYI